VGVRYYISIIVAPKMCNIKV